MFSPRWILAEHLHGDALNLIMRTNIASWKSNHYLESIYHLEIPWLWQAFCVVVMCIIVFFMCGSCICHNKCEYVTKMKLSASTIRSTREIRNLLDLILRTLLSSFHMLYLQLYYFLCCGAFTRNVWRVLFSFSIFDSYRWISIFLPWP